MIYKISRFIIFVCIISCEAKSCKILFYISIENCLSFYIRQKKFFLQEKSNRKPYWNVEYCLVADTDRRYRATEKLLHAEEEYHEVLCSAKELYARPLARSYPEFHDVIFQPLADLSRVSAEHCRRVSQ